MSRCCRRWLAAARAAAGRNAITLTEGANHVLGITVEIARRDPTTRGLQILPRRWAVERTFAWIS